MEELEAKVLGSGVIEIGNEVAFRRAENSGDYSAQYVTVSLPAL